LNLCYTVTPRGYTVIICPCCGFKFEGDLMVGCASCGAKAVGPPLARPQHELPSFGRAFLVGLAGALMLSVLLGFTIAALVQHPPVSTNFWSFVAAGETAAWRLKWLALPITIVVLWGGLRLCRSIRSAPLRFAGRRIAHTGLMTAVMVTLAIATLISVTVPERWRQHRRSIDAGFYAQGYTIQRALLEYRLAYGTLPSDLKDLKERLPDADGSIAAALAGIDPGGYKTTAQMAVVPKTKPGAVRSTIMRNVSAVTDDSPGESVSFTDYDLRLPGEDKLLGNEDDWIVRDGVISRISEVSAKAQRIP
jgi:hypothetical protein